MKSGTTYLSDLLGAHPTVFMSQPKEPDHFVDHGTLRRKWPGAGKTDYRRRMDRYLSLFAGAGDATVIAEASSSYSQLPLFTGVPERILAFNPEARFIYIMRDPVERTISHYWQRVRWGVERRPMLSAIRVDSHYREVSHYARQLNAYLQYVGLERFYILTFEALVADPVGQLSGLYAWLGIDPSFRPSGMEMPRNALPAVVDQVRGFGLLHRLSKAAIYRNVAPFIPRVARRAASALARRPMRPAEIDASAVEAFLRPEQQSQTEELARLLNRSFTDWKTLYARRSSASRACPESSIADHKPVTTDS